ncbi:4-hydroxybenzoate polyprenyltransferase [Kribbella sp. VKM Ac-2527]|uniref:4-hydroxybenzoate polyprenyltransferase n=1 Tax=Kribbella caucasensis TaxID=2512215 RepID=A0A4R6K9D7_9ACTN|nr:UbiA family prenyltransferase [Kribbella sp. VKM Ac-2527]TDO44589.1 4-hydroxybenzoate polyprenyltransferase [Kribbella sp. VKM Ac-2527]
MRGIHNLGRTLLGLALACHPGPTVAVTALVTAIAWSAGRSPAGCLLVAATILTGHLSIGWSNDAIDAVRDTIVNRKDKPIVLGLVSRRTLWIGAYVMLAFTIPVSLANGALAGLVHLLFVACAWAYNLGLKSTPFSWAPYAVAFGGLPSFVTLGTTDTWAPWWATTATALLGIGAHLANVVPDLADDLATGVRGWPQRLGQAARLIAPLPLATATVLLTVAPSGPVGVIGWLALGIVAALLAVIVAWKEAPFLLTIAVAVVSVVVLVIRGDALVP